MKKLLKDIPFYSLYKCFCIVLLCCCNTSQSVSNNYLYDTSYTTDLGHDVEEANVEAYWDQNNRIAIPANLSKCEDISLPLYALKKKAEYYDWVASKIHLVRDRDYSLVHNVVLEHEFPTGINPNWNGKIIYYDDSDNHGLWSSLYVASQAFRYLTTKSEEALANLIKSYKGLYALFMISGVDGLPARNYRDNNISGYECPLDLTAYKKPENRRGNTYVFIDDEGCLMYYDPSRGSMVYDNTKICVDKKYANMCFKRNTSKDEISGHIFASAIIFRLIDNPELKKMSAEILTKIAQHLVRNEYVLKDYDGMKTRYGSFYALSMDEVPGFNALGALVALRSGLVASQDEELKREYYECLLQKRGHTRCIRQPVEYESPRDYREYLKEGLGIMGDCKSTNYDNINMVFLNFFSLITMTGDYEERKEFKKYFIKHTRGPDKSGRYLWYQLNPHFNFILLSMFEEDDKIEESVIERLYRESFCSLKKFPANNIKRFIDNRLHFEPFCEDNEGNQYAKDIIPIDMRCPFEFVWWRDPYKLRVCEENNRFGFNPAGYLLPYWMGRYFGFISEND
ncbi:MAG: hypothetical protein N2746_10965 [Deltaproteobacteria bacterium]|nr:hypothetical protein [Deltaproteobacteria bacterium]